MWHGGLAAWARATFQYHVNGTDTVGRSVGRSVDRPVGRSVDARAPVDHDSVGLAQARPNYESKPGRHSKRKVGCLNKLLAYLWGSYACSPGHLSAADEAWYWAKTRPAQ